MAKMNKFALMLAGLMAFRAFAAEPEAKPEDLPRVPPTPASEALETFELKPGFRIELVAAEPLVADPIAICFDENGRLFAVEMRDYSERRDERLGRIRMLEDLDGDGRMDRSTVFAEDLPWPTAVIWQGGGLFVASSPDIWFLRDTDGDGKADERRVVYTGFGEGVKRLNVQALPNNFKWGLDNRIHGATSYNGGRVRCLEHDQGILELRGKDFSFDPKSLAMRAETGGGQYGLAFDNFGRKFICSNSSHLRQVMYEARYLRPDMTYSLPGGSLEIAVDGGAAEVFRISPDEPWRVIRTKWRVAGLVPGPIEGGGRASGYFTGATGLVIYRGTALGENFVGDAFVADCGSNLIHRKKVRPNGVPFIAERPEDEQKVEFLASRDNWFRPVQLANGPDGALYIIDMYREIIEHPWSLPPGIKQHLDLNSGNDRGRIYRVVREDFEQPEPVRLGKASSEELVKVLEHPNGWHRDTAARLLYERGDKSVAGKVRKLARSSASPVGRLHALAVLEGLGALTERDVLRALRDEGAGVREFALKLSEAFLENGSAALWDGLIGLAADPSERVVYQLPWTAGMAEGERKWEVFERLLGRMDAPWVRHAVLANASTSPGRLWRRLPEQGRFGEAGLELARLAGRRGKAGEIRSFAAELENAEDPELLAGFSALLKGARAGRNEEAVTRVPQMRAARLAAERALEEGTKSAALDAITILSADPERGRELLLARIHPNTPAEIQAAVITALAGRGEKALAGFLIERWNRLTPAVKGHAAEALLRRSESTLMFLRAIEAGRIGASEVPIPERERLRSSRNQELRELAGRVFGKASNASAEELMEEFRGALSFSGSRERGRAIYQERCASCHRFQGEGFEAGPDFETIRQAGKESALANILDPNREVAPRYVSYDIETDVGEVYSGIIAQETPAAISLRQAGGHSMEIPRDSILGMRSSGKSLMPENLQEGLTPRQMADLLEYILGR